MGTSYQLRNGLLYYKNCIPTKDTRLGKEILAHFHNSKRPFRAVKDERLKHFY